MSNRLVLVVAAADAGNAHEVLQQCGHLLLALVDGIEHAGNGVAGSVDRGGLGVHQALSKRRCGARSVSTREGVSESHR
jgi:hypothetical protein